MGVPQRRMCNHVHGLLRCSFFLLEGGIMKYYFFIPLATDEFQVTQKKVTKKKGVNLLDYEVELLELIYKFKAVTSRHIHTYFKHTTNIKGNSITNRLTRLVAAKVLRSKSVATELNGFNLRYYGLNEKGYALLKYLGRIPQDTKVPKTVKSLSKHDTGCISAVLDIYLDNRKRKCYPFVFPFIRGIRHPIIQKLNEEKELSLVPDYVVEHENHLICLEYDMATESLNTIVQKGREYIKLANFMEKEGYKVSVVYLVRKAADEGIAYKRIQSIKRAHLELQEVLDNVPIYCIDESLGPIIVQSLIHNLNGQVEITLSNAVNYQLNKMDHRYNLISRMISISDLAHDIKSETIYSGYQIQVQGFYREEYNVGTHVHMVGEIGSIQTYIQVERLSALLEKANLLNMKKHLQPLELCITYRSITNEELAKEVIGVQPNISIRAQTERELYNRYEEYVSNDNPAFNWSHTYFEVVSVYRQKKVHS